MKVETAVAEDREANRRLIDIHDQIEQIAAM
jgi:hypothetical protein